MPRAARAIDDHVHAAPFSDLQDARERVLFLHVDHGVGAHRLRDFEPPRIRDVPVTMMSEAPACLAAIAQHIPCWPGPWISTDDP